jgi:hypothetical protein
MYDRVGKNLRPGDRPSAPSRGHPPRGGRCDRTSCTVTMTPRAIWHQSAEYGQQVRRLDRVLQRAQIRPSDPCVRVQVGPLMGEQAGAYDRWSLTGEPSDEESLRPDEPLAVPPHVTIDRHRQVKDRGRVETGFLGQLASCGYERSFARLDAATGRLPEPASVERITPVQKKQAMGGVEADDPGCGPVRCLHCPDATRWTIVRGRRTARSRSRSSRGSRRRSRRSLSAGPGA